MGTDDSLSEGGINNEVREGSHGNIVQAGPVGSVNVTAPEPRSQIMPAVLVSVTVLTLLALGALMISAATGNWPANIRQTQEKSGHAAPSPSESASSRPPSAPTAPPAAEGPGADRKGPGPADVPSESSTPAGGTDASKGPERDFPYGKTTELGEEVTGDRAVRCGDFQLCAYRERNHRVRFDFAAPSSSVTDWNTCYSLPAGAPGFVSVFNGRGYTYWVYDKPGCRGEHHLVGAEPRHYDFERFDGFVFFSYAKA